MIWLKYLQLISLIIISDDISFEESPPVLSYHISYHHISSNLTVSHFPGVYLSGRATSPPDVRDRGRALPRHPRLLHHHLPHLAQVLGPPPDSHFLHHLTCPSFSSLLPPSLKKQLSDIPHTPHLISKHTIYPSLLQKISW